MSDHPPTPVDAHSGAEPDAVECPRCDGCGQLADTENREPWTAWTSLPIASSLAVLLGAVKPIPCDECSDSGSGVSE